MNTYKITNLDNNKSYFLNQKEKNNFFTKNNIKNYKEENITEAKRIKHNKRMDILAALCLLTGFICLILIYIQSNY